MKKILLGALASVAMVAGAAPAFALPSDGTVTGTMSVSLNVVPGCTFTNSSASTNSGAVPNALMDFGSVPSGTNTNVDAVATSASSASGGGSMLNVVCSSTYVGANAPYLDLGAGLNAAGTQRNMSGPSGVKAAYNIYTDAGRNTLWLPGQPIQLVIPVANTPTPVYAYGRVAGTTMSPLVDGNYTDMIAMTLYY